MTLSDGGLICLSSTALLHAIMIIPSQIHHAGAGGIVPAQMYKSVLREIRWRPMAALVEQRPAAFVLAHIGTTNKEAILLAGHFLRLVAPGTVPACRSAISPSGRRAPGQRK
jgi:hypothetical protein